MSQISYGICVRRKLTFVKKQAEFCLRNSLIISDMVTLQQYYFYRRFSSTMTSKPIYSRPVAFPAPIYWS